ncbi:MAG TPA: hypothetical protein VJ783_32035, partial [Pirellulales bacterium]|nr:hypothetical protein [Pirellulales bacterium]
GAADTLLRWLASDDQVALEGKPTPLVDLVARLADRGQQTVLVQTYWKLSAALAEYRIAADESARLGQLLPPADATGKHPTDPLLESRLASSEARLREAELAVVDAQYSLAELARLSPTDPPALPADLPHAGPYRTYFQERYARVAPPRGHLIDRSLPLLHRSLELRAMAAVSAADAADADHEAYHAGKLDALTVIETLAELTRQRRAFIAAVRDYNVDIAEYAFSVVPPGLSSAQLVSVLIGPAKPAAGGTSGEKAVVQEPPPVKRAGYDQPAEPANVRPAAPGLLRQGPAAPIGQVPSGAPLRGTGRPPKRVKSYVPKSSATQHTAQFHTAFFAGTPPRGDAGRASEADLHEDASQSGKPDLRANDTADAGLYSAFASLEPAQRLRQLADTLQWDRSSEQTGAATTLVDALAAAGDRRAVIAAYWRGRGRIAACQIRQQQHQQLAALQAAALKLRDQPNAAEAMLRLQTALLAAEAGAVETQVAILASQFELALAMRRPLSGDWPWPSTPPHAGHFRLKLETQPAALVQAMPVRQLARDIPTLYEALLRRAEAVVAADSARAEISARCESGEALVDPAILVTAQTAEESLSLLADQTDYNVQFAEYVLAVAPPTLGAQELAGLLVVAPAANASNL